MSTRSEKASNWGSGPWGHQFFVALLPALKEETAMDWINKLERRWGRFAIPNLIRMVAFLNAAVFLLYKLDPQAIGFLILSPHRVMAGEVWRLVTYIFIPQFGGIFPDWIGAAFYIYYLIWIGDGLEHAMGSFRVNLYYLLGMIGCTIAALFFGETFSGGLLNGSLFFAFARFFPDLMIYVAFVLPVKIKWMAWFLGAILVLNFVIQDNSYRLAMIATFINFVIFFGPEILQDAKMRREVQERRARYARASAPEEAALHRCAVCGRTDLSHPDLEFRVSRDGNEYCNEHRPGPAASGVA